MPQVSIIIPIYNAEKTIRKCIDCAIKQTMKDIEIILVNDGSTDNSSSICDEYARLDSRVVVIHKSNGGVCDARNAGIRACKGDFFSYCESDDWLELDSCEIMYEQVKKYESDFVLAAYYRVQSNGIIIKHPFNDKEIVFLERDVRDILMKKVLGLVGMDLSHPETIDTLLTCSAKLFKTEIVRTNDIYWVSRKETYSDCLDFIFRYTYYSKKAVYINIPLYYYLRTNTGSQTAGYRENTIKLWKKQFDDLNTFIDTNNIRDEMLEAFYNRVCFSIISIGGNAYRRNNRRLALEDINKVLNDPLYIEAFKRLDFSYFKIHWKVFFLLAKLRLTNLFYLNIIFMRKRMNKSRNL